MSGYGNRDRPSEGVETPLYVRAVCLRSSQAKKENAPLLLLSIDNVGLSGANTRRLASAIESKHKISRDRVVFCSTHTHSGPALPDKLSNIFATPLSAAESEAANRYGSQLDQAVLSAVAKSIVDLKPAELSYGVGNARFAANRRVLADGKWTGFGIQEDGPVDHSVPVLKVTAPDGSIRGLIFNYACHCTTVGGNYYKINADWAGYAATELEESFPNSVALCTIGCGADANPNPRGTVEFSQMHGQTLANEVRRLAKSNLSQVDADVDANFDYAALSFDLRTREELEEQLANSRPQTRRHAQRMIKIYEEKGRLPATYPVPIQSWKFGDQLTMIFLGGEVVVDYALRLKKSLDDPNLWVSAYSNDVLGYVASERMRVEGGYEYDRSGIYYGLPGPWASGSEDLLIRRVTDLVRNQGRPGAQPAESSLNAIQVPDGYRVELVAAEPLIQDPVNIAFGESGELWVVEMGDYPEGSGGGRIKSLTDVDGDGVYDKSKTFLADVPFPTGAHPWNGGVLVSTAPNILFAEDTSGDGRADYAEPIFSGFKLANPQHRVNGFSYGLDHSMHLASGDNLGELKAIKRKTTINASGHDVKIWPDSGHIAITSGRTQFIRSRDDFGRWFGNSNSKPMFHFPIDDRYLRRNSFVSYSSNAQQLFSPAVAPPVFPLTSASERFNDLFAANRFTSACSSIVARTPFFKHENDSVAFICEPVHNLVHRAVLKATGSTFRAERANADAKSEFLASSDPWFRPVRAAIGPDGMLYIVDMYREVIEHPEWIPDAWQERLDVRAGERYGRIYRIVPASSKNAALPALGELSNKQLLDQLRSPIGPLRDEAQRLILHSNATGVRDELVSTATNDPSHFARLHALSILESLRKLENETLVGALNDSHPGVLMVAIRLCETRLDESDKLLQALVALTDHSDTSIALQVALALGESDDPEAGKALGKIATRADLDRWLADAVTSSASLHAPEIARSLLWQAKTDPKSLTDNRVSLLQRVLTTAERSGVPTNELVSETLDSTDVTVDVRLRLAECVVGAARDAKSNLASLENVLHPLHKSAKNIARDSLQSEISRCRAVSLISLNLADDESESEFLLSLLDAATPVSVQCEAIDGLVRRNDMNLLTKILDRWPAFSIAVRDHLTSQMLSRRSSAEFLLNALDSDKIRVNEISLSAREQLLKTGSRSMRVRAQRLIRGGGTRERGLIVREYLAQFSSSATKDDRLLAAELIQGQQLFKKHCGTCHSPDPAGIAIGASLDNLSIRTDEALVESILNPNRAVEPKFQSYLVQTEDGRTLSGVIESEVAESLTLAHADGKRTTIRRDEIERIKGTGVSLMPEGFETTLTPEQLQSIVRYLQR